MQTAWFNQWKMRNDLNLISSLNSNLS
jgi:hypothetical protein